MLIECFEIAFTPQAIAHTEVTPQTGTIVRYCMRDSIFLQKESAGASVHGNPMTLATDEYDCIAVVLSADEGYAMPLATALRSIVESYHGRCEIKAYILHDSIVEKTKGRIVRSLLNYPIRIHWLPVDLAAFQEYSTCSHISTTTFARLLIPEVLPPCVSKVIYLDADILVFGDLRALWRTSLNGHPVGAVPDELDELRKTGDTRVVNMPAVRNYFNAGIMLIDVLSWREKGITARAIKYLQQFPSSPFSDQDALNVACDGCWKLLDKRWNVQNNSKLAVGRKAYGPRPNIVHFVTRHKPWHPSTLSPYAAVYDSFRSRTEFRRTAIERFREPVKTYWWRTRRAIRRTVWFRRWWSQIKRMWQSGKGALIERRRGDAEGAQ